MDHDTGLARGRCLPYGEGITYWPVLEAVMDVAGFADGSSRSWGGLARLKRIRVCAFVLSAPRAGDDPVGVRAKAEGLVVGRLAGGLE
jgi:hypothetical protein